MTEASTARLLVHQTEKYEDIEKLAIATPKSSHAVTVSPIFFALFGATATVS
jgi:hypothetical protein